MDSALVAQQCSLESDYKLTFFDSLVAASALSLDPPLFQTTPPLTWCLASAESP